MIVNANALRIPLADESIQCAVTSPPYYGLRDYQVAGQLGLEPTPDEYIANLVSVSREVWRVLRDDGVYWLNLGDSYCNTNGYARASKDYQREGRNNMPANDRSLDELHRAGYKTKDLMLIPARVAIALQSDGWYVRAEIIWAKPNPMPESVKDRPTRSHEMIYLLTKQERYYYDAEAVKESGSAESLKRLDRGVSDHHKNIDGAPGQTPHSMNKPRVNKKYSFRRDENESHPPEKQSQHRPEREDIEYANTRNLRDVWHMATEPYSGAHYATFPTELPRKCIKAGSKPGDVILDPFCGSGTTGQVARELGRRFVGLDLSMKYLRDNALPRAERKQTKESLETLPMFELAEALR